MQGKISSQSTPLICRRKQVRTMFADEGDDNRQMHGPTGYTQQALLFIMLLRAART